MHVWTYFLYLFCIFSSLSLANLAHDNNWKRLFESCHSSWKVFFGIFYWILLNFFYIFRYLATDGHFKKDTSKHHLGCSPQSTKYYILKIFLLTVLFNIPSFFELKTLPNEMEKMEVFGTELRGHPVYTQMYRLMAEFLIFKASPWLAFFILWLSLRRRI